MYVNVRFKFQVFATTDRAKKHKVSNLRIFHSESVETDLSMK